MNNNSVQKEILNAKGKRLLSKTKLNYSMAIINKLQQQPSMLTELLDDMELTKDEFFSYISGEENANISFYDQALESVKRKNLKNR